MTARINTAIGAHWGSVVRAIDVIYAIMAFGALGSVPALINVAAKFARRALTALRGRKHAQRDEAGACAAAPAPPTGSEARSLLSCTRI